MEVITKIKCLMQLYLKHKVIYAKYKILKHNINNYQEFRQHLVADLLTSDLFINL